jgi:hypothetical protein
MMITNQITEHSNLRSRARDSTFFLRGFKYNVLDAQYTAVRALQEEGLITEEGVDAIFRGQHTSSHRLQGLTSRVSAFLFYHR